MNLASLICYSFEGIIITTERAKPQALRYYLRTFVVVMMLIILLVYFILYICYEGIVCNIQKLINNNYRRRSLFEIICIDIINFG